MAKQIINVGTSANSRTGDNIRTAFIKINDNFDEVFQVVEHGLVGPQGPAGAPGSQGPRGLRGDKGDNGANGADGLSAYQIAVNHGFVGTEEEWLASLHGSGGGTGVIGAVYITDINPVSNTDIVNAKVYTNGGKVLTSCSSDTNNLIVSVMARPGTTYTPTVTVNGINVPLTEQLNGTFTGDVIITLSGTTVTAIHNDGPTATCSVANIHKPVILTARFVNGYPSGQSELKAGDTYSFTVTTDINITGIEVVDYGAFTAANITISASTSHTFVGTIANRGNTVHDYGAKIRVTSSTGSVSSYYITDSLGINDGVNTVKLNNVSPTITFGTVTYPGTQQALKNTESATVSVTYSNGDVVSFTSPNNELTIPSPTVLNASKTVTRVAGSYNISTNNLAATITRSANGASSSAQTVVKIANTACTVSVSEQYTRLRLGGSYTITISANQNLLNAPTLTAGVYGTFQGSGFAGLNQTWTRTLSIADTNIPGTYNWGAISATNLAGIVTTTITGDNSYVIGGFTSRNITLDAYANEALLSLPVTDYTKLSITWEIKSLPIKSPVGTTTIPTPNSWCINALNVNPTTIRILDVAATFASSRPTTITVEEIV